MQFREKDINTPIILMGYINNFLIYKDLINRSHDLGLMEFWWLIFRGAVLKITE